MCAKVGAWCSWVEIPLLPKQGRWARVVKLSPGDGRVSKRRLASLLSFLLDPFGANEVESEA